MKQYNIAVAGTGYVGLSIATLLAQHNHVTAVDIIPNKVELINCYSGRQGSLQRCGLRRYCRSYQLRPGEELLRHPSYRRCDRPRHQRKSGCGNDHQINHPRRLHPLTLYKICTTIPSQSGTGRQKIQPALFSGIFA